MCVYTYMHVPIYVRIYAYVYVQMYLHNYIITVILAGKTLEIGYVFRLFVGE